MPSKAALLVRLLVVLANLLACRAAFEAAYTPLKGRVFGCRVPRKYFVVQGEQAGQIQVAGTGRTGHWPHRQRRCGGGEEGCPEAYPPLAISHPNLHPLPAPPLPCSAAGFGDTDEGTGLDPYETGGALLVDQFLSSGCFAG